MHLIDLLSVLLRWTGFTRIQKSIVDQTGSRPPNSDHDVFFGESLALGSVLEFLFSTTTELVITDCCIKFTFCHMPQTDRKMVHCYCIELEKTTLQNDDFFDFQSAHEAPTY